MGEEREYDAASVGLTSVLCQLWKIEVMIALSSSTVSTRAPGNHKSTDSLCIGHEAQ